MKKPNILFLMCDQLQAQALYDSACITPNFDDLRKKGLTFQRAYAPSPVCSPSRASLMTGRLPHNHGVLVVTHTMDEDQSCLRRNGKHWAEILRDHGYNTAYFGKWHVERGENLQEFGWTYDCGKTSSKFLERFKEARNVSSSDIVLEKYLTGKEGYRKELFYQVVKQEPETRMMGITVDLAEEYIKQISKESPWCCFVSIEEPHDPYICGEKAFLRYQLEDIRLPENYKDNMIGKPGLYRRAQKIFEELSDKEVKEARICYYASITEIDKIYGKLLKTIETRGELENTIVILTSDHGDFLGAHGLFCKNTGSFEEAYRIPLIMAGKGIAVGKETKARVGLHDLGDTILELCGLEPRNYKDSKSFASVVRKPEKFEKEFDEGYSEYFGSRMLVTQRVVWKGDWKLVFNGFDCDELYNLAEDPYEKNNLSEEVRCNTVKKELYKVLWKYIKITEDKSLLNCNYPAMHIPEWGPEII